jgi:hypothetical protein
MYLSEYKLFNCPYLEKVLDSDGGGVETDLIKIATLIPDWEEKLVAPLKLTSSQVSTINRGNQGNPDLQR